MSTLAGKRILLGVSGSIAAYKAADLLRRLADQGAEVRVVMTRAATRFIAPLTFEVLSGRPVLTDEFTSGGWGPIGHIAVTDGIDCAVVAPATANIIGKAASGIADDALSTALLAVTAPVIMAPAMNGRMYGNASVQRNRALLAAQGVRFVEPEVGFLACGESGRGRMAPIDSILQAAEAVAAIAGRLTGVRVVVTAGPTREPIDAVRFISNPSSGRMGYALAAAARDSGAEVVLISGPSSLDPPRGVQLVQVVTAAEMSRAVSEQATGASVVIMAAAVSDFRPLSVSDRKIKKDQAELMIPLARTEDILQGLGERKGGRILVGFAAETDDLLVNARKKLEEKNLDLMVANPVGIPGSGFGSETNRAVLMRRDGAVEELPLMTKELIAMRIVDRIAELKANQGL